VADFLPFFAALADDFFVLPTIAGLRFAAEVDFALADFASTLFAPFRERGGDFAMKLLFPVFDDDRQLNQHGPAIFRVQAANGAVGSMSNPG